MWWRTAMRQVLVRASGWGQGTNDGRLPGTCWSLLMMTRGFKLKRRVADNGRLWPPAIILVGYPPCRHRTEKWPSLRLTIRYGGRIFTAVHRNLGSGAQPYNHSRLRWGFCWHSWAQPEPILGWGHRTKHARKVYTGEGKWDDWEDYWDDTIVLESHFHSKKPLGLKKNLIYYTHFTRCSLAGVTRDKYCKCSVQNDLWCMTWTLGRNGTVGLWDRGSWSGASMWH